MRGYLQYYNTSHEFFLAKSSEVFAIFSFKTFERSSACHKKKLMLLSMPGFVLVLYLPLHALQSCFHSVTALGPPPAKSLFSKGTALTIIFRPSWNTPTEAVTGLLRQVSVSGVQYNFQGMVGRWDVEREAGERRGDTFTKGSVWSPLETNLYKYQLSSYGNRNHRLTHT